MKKMLKGACALLLAGATSVASCALAAPGAQSPAAGVPVIALGAGAAEFGAVIDYRRVGVDGLTVLAVTPGGLAEQMGVRAGDRIVAANDQSLVSTNRPSALLEAALAQEGVFRLTIVRDGSQHTLSGTIGPASSTGTPVAGCGHLSTIGSFPRSSRNVFPVVVLSIDGDNKLPVGSGYYKVDAGRHVLVVREHIDTDRFTEFGLSERVRQQARYGPRLDKVLIVDVQPGTTYSIGAQTTRPIETSSIRDNTHWSPVVWRTSQEACH